MSHNRPSVQLSGLDFAQPQRDLQQATPWTGWALLAGALLLALWLAYDGLRSEKLRDTLRETRQHAVHQGNPATLTPTLNAEVRFADETLRQGSIPWEAIFGDVESAARADVSLLQWQAQGRNREIRLAGEAKNFETLTAFLAHLETRPTLASAHLLGHQVQEGRSAVKFDALVRWRQP